MTTKFKRGDLVKKVEGYLWPGEVVSVFKTKAGHTRVVVECTAPAVAGALHIFNPLQLRKTAQSAVPVSKRRVSHTNGNTSNRAQRFAHSDGEG